MFYAKKEQYPWKPGDNGLHDLRRIVLVVCEWLQGTGKIAVETVNKYGCWGTIWGLGHGVVYAGHFMVSPVDTEIVGHRRIKRIRRSHVSPAVYIGKVAASIEDVSHYLLRCCRNCFCFFFWFELSNTGLEMECTCIKWNPIFQKVRRTFCN